MPNDPAGKQTSETDPHTVNQTSKFVCSECGGKALIAYCAGRRKGEDWGGKVKKGERLCTRCFKRRGGENVFGR